MPEPQPPAAQGLQARVQEANRATDEQLRAQPERMVPRRGLAVALAGGLLAGCQSRRSAAVPHIIDRGLAAFEAFLLDAKSWERLRPRAARPAFEDAAPADGRRLPAVSAVVLCKNEAGRIARCLGSLRWAGEVVVVDGESQDDTPAIARAWGARVMSRAFSGSYAEERNAGAAEAGGTWVLQLDADEVVTERFRRRLEEVLHTDGDLMDAFKFQRRSVLLGRAMRYGGWVHYIPNLYRRDRVRYTGLVHERLEGAHRIGVVDAPIDHYAIDALSPYLLTQNRYTTLTAQELWRDRGRVSEAEIRYHLTRKPLKVAWKSYVKKQGFREGQHGLVLAILYGWVHFLAWAKYWELVAERRDGSA